MKKLLLLFVLPLLLWTCKHNQNDFWKGQVLTDQEAKTYLSAYTQGMIMDTDPIEFRFMDTDQFKPDEIERALSVNPTFAFQIEVDTIHTGFKIIPKEKLKRGQSYEVKLALKKVLSTAPQSVLISKIQVFNQYISVKREGLVIDENNRNYVQLFVNTALKETPNRIAAVFSYPIGRVTVDPLGKTQYQVKLFFKPEEGETKVNWDGTKIGAEEKGHIEVWNYGQDQFNVVNTYFDRSASEYNIYFTKLLKVNQDAKGLIQIGKEDVPFRIENNQLTVFLQSKAKEDLNLTINKGLKAKDGSILPLDLQYNI